MPIIQDVIQCQVILSIHPIIMKVLSRTYHIYPGTIPCKTKSARYTSNLPIQCPMTILP